MKKLLLFVLVAVFGLSAYAEETDKSDRDFRGLVRLNVYDLYLLISGPSSTPMPLLMVTPHLSPEVGIAIGIDGGHSSLYPEAFSVGAEAGIEWAPISSLAPGGLYLLGTGGIFYEKRYLNSSDVYGNPYFASYWSSMIRLTAGYHFLANSGLLISIGLGLQYYPNFPSDRAVGLIIGNGLDVVLCVDIGFGYR